MASIFTYEAETPRVASPWLLVDVPTKDHEVHAELEGQPADTLGSAGQSKVRRLQAEPQEGPVEYKLHLLLRPRRKFRSTSTGSRSTGSAHVKSSSASTKKPAVKLSVESTASAAALPAAVLTRQHRLQQLTTQLLWRLQQSSPHHTSSATNIILPSLPEALPELHAPLEPAKLLHGLEESQGALYEIGVTDDGSLIGLAEDEMNESLNNLRAMAACLGCTVDVIRKEVVGDCEWIEDAVVSNKERKLRRIGKLYVAEAFVQPHLSTKDPQLSSAAETDANVTPASALNGHAVPLAETSVAIEQKRITLTGPTMSGKSTLLGTLTMSTLDNGRGKSRLSMLKHRHEIASGVTSSVTQELLGYQDAPDGSVEVVNYATENVASWIDIHVAAASGHLVLISDSAGHPRYRRTTIRGLVGWAPHWTLLCIPAEDDERTGRQRTSSTDLPLSPVNAAPDMDLVGAQLDLCLRLRLPLVVVITKMDTASRTGLRQTLTKVLDALKAAVRRPAILQNQPGMVSEDMLQYVDEAALSQAYSAAVPLLNDPTATVPIVLTSALDGSGIGNLHALLHELPAPREDSVTTSSALNIFHIEDIYTKLAEADGVIVSGRLRSGKLTVGDILLLGPFLTAYSQEDSEDSDERTPRRPSSALPTSRSFPGALRDLHLGAHFYALPGQEWKQVKVSSIRNLRLPVASLLADQVGTIAIVANDQNQGALLPLSSVIARTRKGMVLATVQPTATKTFVAKFDREDLASLAVGNHVVVYIASVRASARIVSARAPDSPTTTHDDQDEEHFAFDRDTPAPQIAEGALDGHHDKVPVAGAITATHLLVTFSFDTSKEFVLIGDQVLIMPGGGAVSHGGQERGQKGVAGLDGFVGRVVEVYG
ncbi:hypothetical protein B0A48_12780 [Cryoendolithus antarcticus]|uniref:Tr-type G domain-containing protein n=1 Tax=Cryoendolithus antarcticus TaxID=1507870 RepID=A0A1V8SRE7_9PEZI|nr:hypothetical protein B0A48_12780 [Cryoendolithus antarcticus]